MPLCYEVERQMAELSVNVECLDSLAKEVDELLLFAETTGPPQTSIRTPPDTSSSSDDDAEDQWDLRSVLNLQAIQKLDIKTIEVFNSENTSSNVHPCNDFDILKHDTHISLNNKVSSSSISSSTEKIIDDAVDTAIHQRRDDGPRSPTRSNWDLDLTADSKSLRRNISSVKQVDKRGRSKTTVGLPSFDNQDIDLNGTFEISSIPSNIKVDPPLNSLSIMNSSRMQDNLVTATLGETASSKDTEESEVSSENNMYVDNSGVDDFDWSHRLSSHVQYLDRLALENNALRDDIQHMSGGVKMVTSNSFQSNASSHIIIIDNHSSNSSQNMLSSPKNNPNTHHRCSSIRDMLETSHLPHNIELISTVTNASCKHDQLNANNVASPVIIASLESEHQESKELSLKRPDTHYTCRARGKKEKRKAEKPHSISRETIDRLSKAKPRREARDPTTSIPEDVLLVQEKWGNNTTNGRVFNRLYYGKNYKANPALEEATVKNNIIAIPLDESEATLLLHEEIKSGDLIVTDNDVLHFGPNNNKKILKALKKLDYINIVSSLANNKNNIIRSPKVRPEVLKSASAARRFSFVKTESSSNNSRVNKLLLLERRLNVAENKLKSMMKQLSNEIDTLQHRIKRSKRTVRCVELDFVDILRPVFDQLPPFCLSKCEGVSNRLRLVSFQLNLWEHHCKTDWPTTQWALLQVETRFGKRLTCDDWKLAYSCKYLVDKIMHISSNSPVQEYVSVLNRVSDINFFTYSECLCVNGQQVFWWERLFSSARRLPVSEITRTMINLGVDVTKVPSPPHRTLLHCSIMYGHAATASILVNNGALLTNVSVGDNSISSAVDVARQYSLLWNTRQSPEDYSVDTGTHFITLPEPVRRRRALGTSKILDYLLRWENPIMASPNLNPFQRLVEGVWTRESKRKRRLVNDVKFHNIEKDIKSVHRQPEKIMKSSQNYSPIPIIRKMWSVRYVPIITLASGRSGLVAWIQRQFYNDLTQFGLSVDLHILNSVIVECMSIIKVRGITLETTNSNGFCIQNCSAIPGCTLGIHLKLDIENNVKSIFIDFTITGAVDKLENMQFSKFLNI